jgi:ABC-2 type transport system permease protein
MGRGPMKTYLALLRAETAILLRDRMAVFFTFLFPLVFILIFGFLMGDIDETDARLGVAEVSTEALDPALLESAGPSEIREFSSRDELESAIRDRDVEFGLVWDGKSLEFLYHPNRLQENYAFQQMAAGIADAVNLRAQNLHPVLPVDERHVGTEASTRWFNQMVPGIIAFSILSAGLFAVSGHLTGMKERHTLDRLLVTPMVPVALLAAIATVRLVVVYVSTLVTLAASIAIFRLAFSIDWLAYTLLVTCATVGTMGLGTVIALLVRRPSSAGNVANILAMVMMFLSGIYFPVEFMPRFLQALSLALPLRHLADAMRFATGVSDMSPLRFWLIVLSFLAAGVLLFPILARYAVRPQRR